MNNKINQTYYLLALVVLMLLMLSVVSERYDVGHFGLKKINILADLLPHDSTAIAQHDPSLNMPIDTAFADTTYTETYLEDTLTLHPAHQQKTDGGGDTSSKSIKGAGNLPAKNTVDTDRTPLPKSIKNTKVDKATEDDLANIKATSTQDYLEDYTADGDGLHALQMTMRAYRNAGQKVRIAFLADSFVEGDIMLGYLRDLLQTEWGGNGVGFVPIATPSAHFRNSVTHTFSKNWTTYSILDAGKTSRYLGMTGYCHQPADEGESWVSYKSTNSYKNSTYFNQARLFYLNPAHDGARVKYRINKGEIFSKTLTTDDHLHELLIKSDEKIKGIDFYFDSIPDVWIYGAALEGKDGVYIDNFSVRGVSGPQLKRIRSEMFEEFDRLQNYSLVVLQYGLNVGIPTQAHLDNYQKTMDAAVLHVKKAFPNATIMLVGVSDRSVNQDGEFVTAPNLEKLIAAQQKLAKKHKLLFWNMYNAMGGTNSISTYVANGWANKDYTHLNFKGGKEVARMFAKMLLN